MAKASAEQDCLHRLSRLTRRSEFLKIASHGQKAVASTLVVQAIDAVRHQTKYTVRQENISEDVIRVGFTVTKKQGGAVIRNRIRRRLKAAAADILPKQGKAGWDYVIIGRHTALRAPFDIITRDLGYAIRKATKAAETQK